MKTIDINTLTPDQLIARVQELEKQLSNCEVEQSDEYTVHLPIKTAGEMWVEIAKVLNYTRGKNDPWYDMIDLVRNDLAFLGRISQDIHLAQYVRDEMTLSDSGRPLDPEQLQKLVFFVDRLNSLFHTIEGKFTEFWREDTKKH
jgi:hypothetical protein